MLRDDLETPDTVGPERWLVAPPAPHRRPGQPRPRFSVALRRQLPAKLLEEFVHLEGDQEILAFANRVGWLHGRRSAQTPDGRSLAGEPLSFWREQVRLVERVLDLANKARRLEESKAETHRSALRDMLGAAPTTTDAQLAGMARGEAALIVQSRLAQLVDFRITPATAGRAGTIDYAAYSLLGAIYLQVARLLTGRLGRWRNCRYCGKPFLASRSDAQFHSATCRSNARYQRTSGSASPAPPTRSV